MGIKVRKANARLAGLQRRIYTNGTKTLDPGTVDRARDDMLAARLEEAIDAALSPEAPYRPLSTTQRERLARYLLG